MRWNVSAGAEPFINLLSPIFMSSVHGLVDDALDPELDDPACEPGDDARHYYLAKLYKLIKISGKCLNMVTDNTQKRSLLKKNLTLWALSLVLGLGKFL